MTKKEKVFLILICVVLVIAIILVSIFLLYPRFAGRPDWQIKSALSFNDDSWIEQMVNNRIKPTEKAIDISSSFVYSTDTAFITYIYGSTTSIADAKKYYLDMISGSVAERIQHIRVRVIYAKNHTRFRADGGCVG